MTSKTFLKTVLLSTTCIILMAGMAWALPENALSRFQQANMFYRDGNFNSSTDLYRALTKDYPRVSTFYYDLGNSLYREGHLGPAILAMERAKLFEPRDKDIRENLDFMTSLLEYRVEDKRNWYLKITEKLLETFTEKEVNILWMSFYFLFIASWVYVLFFQQGAPWGWKRKTLLVLVLLFGALGAAKNVETRIFRDAIVMQNNAEVRYGPSDGDQVAFRLGEGLRVYLMDKRENWSRILIVNGEGGWIKNSQISEVRP